MFTAITAVLSILFSSVATVVITKMTLKKRQPLIEAQVAKISIETMSKVLEAQKSENEARKAENEEQKKANKEVTNQLKAVKNELEKFRKAFEKTNTCPHAVDCPVIHELQDGKKQPRAKD